MNNKTFGFILVVLIVFFNFFFRYPFLNLPLERDEGEYAYISNVIADGGVPYKDAFDQKPPGIFYLYYLVFLLFGKKVIALRFFVVFYNLFSAYFIYRIGNLLKDKNTGLLAALVFVITTSERRLLGFSANTEIFMLAPIIAGTYFSLLFLETKKLNNLFISGFMFSAATLIKQPAFLNFISICAILGYYGFKNKANIVWHIKSYSVMLSAFLLPLLLVSLYFLKAGAFNEFKYQALLHNISYIGWNIPKEYMLKNLFDTIKFILQSQLVIWVLLLIGIVVIMVKRNIKYFELLLFWFVFSILAVSLGKRFTLHYFQQLMPPLALIASIGFLSVLSFLGQKKNKPPKLSFSLVAVLLMIVFLPYYANRAYASHTARELTSAVYSGNPFNEAVIAADFIKSRTTSIDKIFIVGSEPQILCYADRKSVSKYIFFYPLTGGYADSLSKQKEVISDLKKSLPKYIVYANYALSLGVTPASPRYIFEEISKVLQQYNLSALINPERPDYIYSGKELDAFFQTEKNVFGAERLFIYERIDKQ